MQRFRGMISSLGSQTGVFWNRLDITETELVLWSLLEGDRRLARSDLQHVLFDPVHLPPFYWRTSIRFVMSDGRRWPEWFVTLRPWRVRKALEAAGWPVVVLETVGYRYALRRLAPSRSRERSS